MDFTWPNLRILGFSFYGTSLFHPTFVCWVSNGVIKRYLSPFKLSCLSRQAHCITTQLGQRLLTSLAQSSCVFHSFKYDTILSFVLLMLRQEDSYNLHRLTYLQTPTWEISDTFIVCWHAYIFRKDHDLQHAFLWNNKCLFKWANLEAVIRLNREELLTPYSVLSEPIFSSFHSWVHYNVSMRMKSPLTTCFVRQKAKFLCLTKYWIM